MDPGGLLPHSQQPATCPYPERGPNSCVNKDEMTLPETDHIFTQRTNQEVTPLHTNHWPSTFEIQEDNSSIPAAANISIL
jgi:hypothetical protein